MYAKSPDHGIVAPWLPNGVGPGTTVVIAGTERGQTGRLDGVVAVRAARRIDGVARIVRYIASAP